MKQSDFKAVDLIEQILEFHHSDMLDATETLQRIAETLREFGITVGEIE